MNIEQEQRLEKFFKDNQNKGIAIAITGCWGVGKTFAWNRFLQEKAISEKDRRHLPLNIRSKYPNIFNKKYSYVSLFGIESLADLKLAISTNMSSNYFNEENTQNFEIPNFIKKGLSLFRDVKINGGAGGYGINSSARILEAILYSQVKDAIICFDDFERMSKKLDIQDVMGLANQLKLERNCQVVLILDEAKTETENLKKYSEYKEKLIDEVIKINSVEPLIRENTKGIDHALVDVMVKFADELEIHNFRFFQKVIKLYRQFVEQLPEEIADSTKETILLRILQGYFIEDYGETYQLTWSDFCIANSLTLGDENAARNKNYSIFNKLRNVNYKLAVAGDDWQIQFQNWFEQRNEVDLDQLRELAHSDLISEENNRNLDSFHQLFEDFWALKVDDQFPDELYKRTKRVIGIEKLKNISFALNLLENFNEDKKVIELENDTSDWIINKIKTKGRLFVETLSKSKGIDGNRDRFIEILNNYERYIVNSFVLIDAIYKVYVEEIQDINCERSINEATYIDWKSFLFTEILNDPRYKQIDSFDLLKSILKSKQYDEYGEKIKKIIIDTFIEKGSESEFYYNYMRYLIQGLDD